MEKEQPVLDPSLGIITLSEVSANRQQLHGSHLNHHVFYAISLYQGECVRRNEHDSYLPHHGKPVAEVYLAPEQFTRFVTSVGRGGGTPCTFRYRADHGHVMPEFIPADNPHLAMKKAINQTARTVASQLEEIGAMLASNTKLSQKDRAALSEVLLKTKQNIATGLPYLIDQLEEQMEEVVADAVIAVDAHVESVVRSLGMDHLRENFPTLAIESGHTVLLESSPIIEATILEDNHGS